MQDWESDVHVQKPFHCPTQRDRVGEREREREREREEGQEAEADIEDPRVEKSSFMISRRP